MNETTVPVPIEKNWVRLSLFLGTWKNRKKIKSSIFLLQVLVDQKFNKKHYLLFI